MSHLTILDWLPLLSILAFSSAYWYEVGKVTVARRILKWVGSHLDWMEKTPTRPTMTSSPWQPVARRTAGPNHAAYPPCQERPYLCRAQTGCCSCDGG